MALRIPAIRQLSRQIVISIDVAQAALRVGVPLRQREARHAVVELARRPCGDRMASRAGRRCRRETRRYVVWHIPAEGLRAHPCRLVAGHAIRRAQRVIVVDVAGSAGRWRRRHVRAHKREARYAVVKGGGVPADRRVAVRAIGRRERRAGSRVHRVVGLLPVGQVAARVAAGGRGNLQIVIVADVAGCAGNVRVPIREQKSRNAVIKRYNCP